MTGTITVSGVVASNYVTREWLNNDLISGQLLHRLQHGAVLPYRVYCHLLGACQDETYDESTGFSPYVQFWYRVEQWQLELPHFLQVLFLLVLSAPCVFFAVVGKALSDWNSMHCVAVFAAAVVLATKAVACRRTVVGKAL